MHEVSLMQNLLEVVETTARREGGGRVSLIRMRIGEMSGVSTDALDFAFEVLSRGTAAEGGRIEYERVTLSARCRGCGGAFAPEGMVFRCPGCGDADVEVVSGREMEIDYILMDEGAEAELNAPDTRGQGPARTEQGDSG